MRRSDKGEVEEIRGWEARKSDGEAEEAGK